MIESNDFRWPSIFSNLFSLFRKIELWWSFTESWAVIIYLFIAHYFFSLNMPPTLYQNTCAFGGRDNLHDHLYWCVFVPEHEPSLVSECHRGKFYRSVKDILSRHHLASSSAQPTIQFPPAFYFVAGPFPLPLKISHFLKAVFGAMENGEMSLKQAKYT